MNLRKFSLFLLLAAFVAANLFTALPAHSQAASTRLLIPMGGGYSDVYAGFSAAAIANARNGQVKILVLPSPYATNAQSITQAERTTNLKDAEERRFQIESACQRAAPAGLSCQAILAPIFTRSDAADPANLSLFSADLSAVFILGGDQTVAMQAIGDTPTEQILADLYQSGVIIGGTSAGAGMQAAAMLGGYAANAAAESALNFGSSDIWNSAERHGLRFSLQSAMLDQHFYQRGRLGRLLAAVARPDVPHIGIGLDAYTGLLIRNETRLESVFGLYTVTIVDAETYHAAQGVRYVGPANTLSLRNLLLHLLSPGDSAYDLSTRQHSLSPTLPSIERSFEMLALPAGAGPLLLGGDLSGSLNANPVLARFVELCGGSQAKIVILAAGYPSDSSAQRTADKYAAALGVPSQIIIIGKETVAPPQLPADASGILFIGRDQSQLKLETLPDLRAAWLNGTPLLADNAAAAVLGAFYSAHEPVPSEGEEQELAAQKSFLQGRTQIQPGLGLLAVTLEPQVLSNNRWGRVFSLAYNHPDLPALALGSGAALEIGPQGARLLGESVLVSLDLRHAGLALGSNQGFVIANGLLDVFAPGDQVQPENADANAILLPQPTPLLPSVPPTAVPTLASPALPTATAPTLSLALPLAQGSSPTATAQPTAAQADEPTPNPTAGLPEPGSLLPMGGGLLLGLLLLGGAAWLSRRKR